MEFLFGLVFTLVKVTIQASFYGAVLLGAARLLALAGVDNAVVRASRNTQRFWRLSAAVAGTVLLLFSFTYWGRHGLGDYARIPLGHGEAVEEINGTEPYFIPTAAVNRPGDQAPIADFQVSNGTFCAQYPDGTYFTYDLLTKRYEEFADSTAYHTYAQARALPAADVFESFGTHYRRYWLGWRFWLLA